MVRGYIPSGIDYDQDFVNIAYRANGGNVFLGDITQDWWLYYVQGTDVNPPGTADARDFNDYVALGHYANVLSGSDYGTLPLAGQVQRLSLDACSVSGDYHFY